MPGKGTSKRFPHGKSVRNPATYDALVKGGMSKSSAAAISVNFSSVAGLTDSKYFPEPGGTNFPPTNNSCLGAMT